VGVQDATRYVHIVPGVRVMPVQSVSVFNEDLLCAGKDEEALVVLVAVDRHHDTGRDHASHHAEVGAAIIWACDEFDRRPEHVHDGVRRSFDDTAEHRAAARFTLNVCPPFDPVGGAGWL
jgi:hypothetical protein